MKIVLDLPEWVGGKHIYVLAGIELVAYREVGGGWMVKDDRCSKCGRCCEDCEDLIQDGGKMVCGLGVKRPFKCCVGLGIKIFSGCTEKYGRN